VDPISRRGEGEASERSRNDRKVALQKARNTYSCPARTDDEAEHTCPGSDTCLAGPAIIQ
jgi:hypothetical protein